MKQTIEYYYNLVIEDLFLENDTYHFIYDGYDYFFVSFNRENKDLNDIIEVSKELKERNVNCHDIIVNVSGEVLTKVEEVNYLLLRCKDKDKTYSIIDILEMNKKFKLANARLNLYRNNWGLLWSEKIDYIESQLLEIKVPKIIHNSIDYYIGLTESTIYYVNLINTKYSISSLDNICLSHKRIYYPNTKLNYLNPLSFIFDLEIRDIAEYIKACFFAGEDAFLELVTYLKSVKLTVYSYNMLFVRLLFPSYYWDCYEQIVNKHHDSEKMLKIISKQDEYELFLKKAYLEISKYAPLEDIKYLIY